MDIYQIIPLFFLLPFAAFCAVIFIPATKEKWITGITIGISVVQLIISVGVAMGFMLDTSGWLNSNFLTLYEGPSFQFMISCYYDKASAVFSVVGAFLFFAVSIFSKYYMHRDEGFKRFFLSMLMFCAGYYLIILGGNFETLFIGWELLGIISFLLIAFYRDRYLPVKNGFKVLSYYRLGDILLILSMWLNHHLWHRNISFAELNNNEMIASIIESHHVSFLIMVMLLVMVAFIKSAQVPFSSWLPRAMEGPTTSSAIFYGSLTVHLGVFLLIRTYPFWENEIFVKVIVVSVGLVTALIATFISNVQSTVKTQIAYSSIAQIGLMLIEVALGWHTVALVHFTGNAILRTFQLLVSPSVLSYMVHNMYFRANKKREGVSTGFRGRISSTLLVLGIREWKLDSINKLLFWNPFKRIGKAMSLFSGKRWMWIFAVIAISGLLMWRFLSGTHMNSLDFLPLVLGTLALLLVLKVFADRGSAIVSWFYISVSQMFLLLAVLWNSTVAAHQVLIYASGTLVGLVIGFFSLYYIKRNENSISLNQYHGHSFEHPVRSAVFLLACLAVSGFPLSPTFIGVDLLFTHVRSEQIFLVVVLALNFLFLELALIRIYTRIFLGQHIKAYHPIAFKSS